MVELKNDLFYQELARHEDCCVDYCLMKNETSERGEPSHRAALRFAMQRLSADCDEPWRCDLDAASCREIDAETFLSPPQKAWKEKETWRDGSVVVRYDRPPKGELPYWYAFLVPPHGSRDTAEDFLALNRALFPHGAETLTVYEWTTDWSDYFDDGHEWWGAACWSVYDRAEDRYAVILASATD